MIRGVGPYSMLITPISGSLFHAEFQTTAPQAQNWDPRIKALVPFPPVLENMSNQLARSRVEHVLAVQKFQLGLIVRTVGMVRARVKIGLANLAYNFRRQAWLDGQAAPT